MKIDFSSQVPIYHQIAQSIENDIIKGIYEEETQVPSTTEISLNYKINPATVAKGYNLLVDDSIIYKKRGVGMFVALGAKKTLTNKRKKDFSKTYVKKLLEEADKLEITVEEIIEMIKGADGNE
ncbi:MAG TPA: GntR family transcriptional regulator [Clostridiales bacterium]|jgi:DNA-binding transcriptional regulator YhcF (GntR family)|nr:GntR family transcriptional regulator [Clostridiales bacterium]